MFDHLIGVALGGGGARGSAHIGVLEYLESIDFSFDVISGNSAGAVIAALYAFGVDIETMKGELPYMTPVGWTDIKFRELGLFDNASLKKTLLKLLPENAQIEDAQIPLAIQTTDLVTGNMHIFTEGNVIDAVMASSCIPGMYLPHQFGDMILVDGGLTENVPLSALKKLGAFYYIAVNLNGHEGYERPSTILAILTNAMDIAIDAQTRAQLNRADLVISMDLSGYSRVNADHFHEMVEEGKKAAEDAIAGKPSLGYYLRFKHFARMIKSLAPVKIPDLLKPKEEHEEI